jgi:hypothetical protein
VDDTGRVDRGPWETREFLTVLGRCLERAVGAERPVGEPVAR